MVADVRDVTLILETSAGIGPETKGPGGSMPGPDAGRSLQRCRQSSVFTGMGTERDRMIILFLLLLVIAALALGVLGIVVHGLLYLLFTGVGVLIIAFILGALWMRRRTTRKHRRR